MCVLVKRMGKYKNENYEREYYLKIKERRKQYLTDNKKHIKKTVRNYSLRRKYKISLDDYDALYNKQQGKCAICGNPEELLHIDHNHITGEVRGLLCLKCNRGIGFLNDDIKILEQALAYLKQ